MYVCVKEQVMKGKGWQVSPRLGGGRFRSGGSMLIEVVVLEGRQDGGAPGGSWEGCSKGGGR